MILPAALLALLAIAPADAHLRATGAFGGASKTPIETLSGTDAAGSASGLAADGRSAFVAYWDSGFIELDVSNPAQPTLVKRAAYPATADGDGHSSNFDEDRSLLFSADEDFSKSCGSGTEKGFGYLRVWDWSGSGAPRQVGSYKTPNSSGTKDVNAGDYTIHNPLLLGDEIFASWYTDGIRIIDVADPASPRETAHFVPPSENNPVKPSQRGTLTNATQVWGVAHDPVTNLIYASDMNSGLWILRRTG